MLTLVFLSPESLIIVGFIIGRTDLLLICLIIDARAGVLTWCTGAIKGAALRLAVLRKAN